MYFGETLEEKRESYELLDQGAKKLGNIFKVFGWIVTIILSIVLLSVVKQKLVAILLIILIVAVAPITYYWMGYIWFYGFLTVKSWFAKLGIGAADTGAVVGGSIAVSYLLGGRRSAKVTGISWLVAFAIAISIGFYIGLYKFLKLRSEIKKAGIA